MARRRLSNQQRARIARIQAQRRERADAKAAAQIDGDSEQQRGRVVVRHGQNLLIRDQNNQHVHCLFRQNLGEVVCGDQVLWQPTEEAGHGVVVALEPRATTLSRPDFSGRDKPIAANITQLITVLAPKPEPSGYLLDQYLIAAERIGVRGLICLNKSDLMTAEQSATFNARYAHYASLGYPVIQISAKTEHGLQPLLDRLQSHTSILVGQSGVGKSSLINAILPRQDVLEGRLSDSTGLGKHTTSAATLYQLDGGGKIIDSPGVRSFRLGELDRQSLQQGFPELAKWQGQCRFSNCSHTLEPGCAIQAALERGEIHPDRLESFLHMAEQLSKNA